MVEGGSGLQAVLGGWGGGGGIEVDGWTLGKVSCVEEIEKGCQWSSGWIFVM